ncbi:hypothetical protein VN97_g12908, partial [Penicillium thymicola]
SSPANPTETPESGLLAELRFDDIPVDAISHSPLH